MKVKNLVAFMATVSMVAASAAMALVPVQQDTASLSFSGKSIPATTANQGVNDCTLTNPLGLIDDVLGLSFSGNSLGAGDDILDGPTSPLCAGAGYGGGFNQEEEIHDFTVNSNGVWRFDTGCAFANTNPGGDTSIHLRDGCPGNIIGCNGDACGNFSSVLDQFLLAGTQYFLVVEAFSSAYSGPYDVQVSQIAPACVDALTDCDDGDDCNGIETCSADGECLAGTPVVCAEPFQVCNPVGGACNNPPDCTGWLNASAGGFFFPNVNSCGPNCGTGDSVQLRTGAGRDLIGYSFEIIARAGGAEVVGDPYTVSTDLYTIAVTGLPDVVIPGTHCDFTFTVNAGGSPADIANCEPNGGLPTGVIIPEGAFGTQTIIIQSSSAGVSGFLIAGGGNLAGGDMNPATLDGVEAAFGQTIFYRELTAGTGDWVATGFAAPTVNDFAAASVCVLEVGPCCAADNTCSMLSADDCAAAGGTLTLGLNTLSNQVTCADVDCDGDGVAAGSDNCPLVSNAGQEDCDGDGAGDACDPEGDVDADGDGVCENVDNCPGLANAAQVNSDLDSHGDLCDNCINKDNEDQADGDGDTVGDVCDNCEFTANTNQVDTDSDTFGDACDDCPEDANKIAPGTCGCGVADIGDSDGDGVLDCVDTCPGADDAVFGECRNNIPTVSEWGLVVLALLLLVAGKVYYGRRNAMV